jgi:hypothetical protein
MVGGPRRRKTSSELTATVGLDGTGMTQEKSSALPAYWIWMMAKTSPVS